MEKNSVVRGSLTALIALAAMCLPAPASAQIQGNAAAGQKLAVRLCGDCHRTEAGPGLSPLGAAPRFSAVAKTKGMSALALNVWMKTSHPTMPNIQLTDDASDDIIAYILSLRSAPGSATQKSAPDNRL